MPRNIESTCSCESAPTFTPPSSQQGVTSFGRIEPQRGLPGPAASASRRQRSTGSDRTTLPRPPRPVAARPSASWRWAQRRLRRSLWSAAYARSMRIGIVGGGIGGFSAALSLARNGHDISVFERAASLSEVGAGVQISPNAWRVLRWLGLGDEFADIAVLPTRVVFRRWEDDSVIRANDLDAEITATWG
eukprot:gene57744-77071_t